MSYQRNLSPLVIFLIITNLLAFVRGQQESCFNNGNYTSNSTYQANLNTVLSTLSTNIDDNGFYNASLGQYPDRVNAFAFCLGDTQLDTCRSCLRNATTMILQSCPNYRQAHLWNNLCLLRYSNGSILGNLDNTVLWAFYNTQNATNPGVFMSNLSSLLGDIRARASNGGSLRKVAAGNTSTSSGFLQTIFGMAQCTPDLSRQDCYSCLTTLIGYFPGCCYPAIGARVNTRSCFFQYEVGPFFNETRLQELDPTAPSPPVPMPSPPLPSQPTGNNNNRNNNTSRTTIITIAVVSASVGLIIVVLICFLIMRRNRKPKQEKELGEATDEISIAESLHYDFGTIKAATNDFSDANKLGQGGFGAVYKGKLSNGQEIAVKRLSKGSSQGDLEFKNEVMLLVKLQHRNLVRLLGFSLEGSEKLLVYEFVQNASLDTFIFDPTKRSLLDWDRRYKIIMGIARGILYLHEDSRLRIIHRDLKASNVLLDADLNPKIADFGMARLFVPDETQCSTSRIVGTYGYMSPEYAMRGQYSVKSDVFSFGVLMLEIISGQKNNCFRHGETEGDLISSAWENWSKGTTANMIDPALRVGTNIPRDILRCIHISLLCVQENAVDRPTMASFILMLNSFSITMPLPSHPAFYVRDGYDSESISLPIQEFSWGESNFDRPSNNKGVESGDSMSQNEMSISEFYGR